jgi:DNA-binding NarL/FixJ family response regulator
MRLLIVDDHEIVRRGLVTTLGQLPHTTVVGAVSTGREALSAVRHSNPDVALVDLRLPDMRGDELCREVRALSPGTSVVILTAYLSEETVRNSLGAGASAYVTKSAGVAELTEVLERIRANPHARVGVDAGAQLVKRLDRVVAERHQGALHITPQQEQILELAAAGLTNRGIGERLYLSESTVRFHVQKLKKQLHASTRAELVARAIRSGVIAPAPEDVEAASTS